MTPTPKQLDEWQAICDAATPGPWSYESYPSGSRAVSFNYPRTGPFGSPKSPDRINRHILEVRQRLCDCCPENALHWVGADHDEQEASDLEFIATARTALPAALAALREMQWRPIDDEARSGKAILCVYHDSLGREHNAHAKYIPRFTEQVPFSDDNAEYCEEKDEYFTSEGWYEICEAGLDYNSWKMDYEPTLYMNIPAPPAQNAAQPGGEG